MIVNIRDNRCDHLRWKGLFVDSEYDPTQPHPDDRIFWCLKTQQCVGPDGSIVGHRECDGSRPCFKQL